MKSTPTDQRRKSKRELANAIMNFFTAHPAHEMSKAALYKELEIKKHPSKLLVNEILEDLVACKYLSLATSGLYRSALQKGLVEGVVVRRGSQIGFTPNGETDPVRINEKHSINALDGDTVTAMLTTVNRRGLREARIMSIVKRAKDTFVGVLNVEKHFAFLDTPDRYLPYDIFIPKSELGTARSGDKAIVKIVEWPSKRNRSPVGRIVDILGATGDNNTEMHAILAEFGLPYSYPERLEKLADKIPAEISDAEVKKRIDCRDITTFTIDPRDAKDFDDALSLRKLANGLWEVGVHIADVTHYIKEGSPIDEEAYKRATSVYLVDRTIPMLPERLCNYICSLRPDEDKLAYSVIFQLDDDAKVQSYNIARTVIRSNRRFMYEEVQAIFEQNGEASPEDLLKPGDHPKRVKPLPDGSPVGDYAKELITLNRLAKSLKAERMRGGSIEFQRDEVHFEIDDKGHPIGTYIKVSQDAHKLVEEFMLLANKYVAQKIGMVPRGQKAKVFPYRVHDVPDLQKLERLSVFVSRFGYNIKTTGSRSDVSKGINEMLHRAQGSKEQAMVEDVTLRSMMKACYTTHNVGHYGLMFRYYTHFTSPIRRYPDEMVHRLLTRYLDGGRSVNQQRLEEQCEHSSAMEQVAANAERASIKYKQVEFMANKLGEEFEGKVSGVTDFAIFVELTESKCEGTIPLRTLKDDYYSYNERTFEVVGRRKHRRIGLADPVRIRVAAANIERRQLDFELLEVKGHEL